MSVILNVSLVFGNFSFGCDSVFQPERIKPDQDNPGYNVKSDVWSLGITLVTFMFLITLQQLCISW